MTDARKQLEALRNIILFDVSMQRRLLSVPSPSDDDYKPLVDELVAIASANELNLVTTANIREFCKDFSLELDPDSPVCVEIGKATTLTTASDSAGSDTEMFEQVLKTLSPPGTHPTSRGVGICHW